MFQWYFDHRHDDTITDFTAGQDVIDLSAIDAIRGGDRRGHARELRVIGVPAAATAEASHFRREDPKVEMTRSTDCAGIARRMNMHNVGSDCHVDSGRNPETPCRRKD